MMRNTFNTVKNSTEGLISSAPVQIPGFGSKESSTNIISNTPSIPGI